jgi:transposase
MKLDNDNVKKTLETAKTMLAKEENISPALLAVLNLLLIFMQVMLDKLGLNSKNSSKPPSTDLNRKKNRDNKNPSKRKPGGQKGRIGKQLKPVCDPDIIEMLTIDKRTLPKGVYKENGFEARQIIDFEISVIVTEYRAQVLVDEKGNRYIADFPEFVTRPIQYGTNTKSTSVYMSQYQLLPYKRIEDYFEEQADLPISAGSIFNFNKEAYEKLAQFEQIAKANLISSKLNHADETGINVNGKRIWLHTVCNAKWTYFFPHEKRGSEAMDTIGILPLFKGVLCHDHWKAYYKYHCLHALCNAHHLRELEWSATEDTQKWAKVMKAFLEKLNKKVIHAGGKLSFEQCTQYRKRYNQILLLGEKSCPSQKSTRKPGQRGKIKKTKSRNLLERLMNYQDDVLRFMYDIDVPFTNNQGENDLRMTKVQQKISGCFRSIEGAYIFCRIRAYLITCSKHGINGTVALKILFQGKLPDFVNN